MLTEQPLWLSALCCSRGFSVQGRSTIAPCHKTSTDSWRACRRISTRVAAETIKKAIEEGHCANERAVKAAAEGDVSLQVRRFLPYSSPCCFTGPGCLCACADGQWQPQDTPAISYSGLRCLEAQAAKMSSAHIHVH